MKSLLLFLFLMLVSLGHSASGITVPTALPVSDDVLLSAIGEVETGNDPSRLGRYGERTRLQILPSTWRQFSRLPHAAGNRAETDRVARAYLAFIRTRLKARGLPDTPFFIAACWNAGPGWKRLRAGTVAYAERVANVVESLQPKGAAPRMSAPTVPVIDLADTTPPAAQSGVAAPRLFASTR